MFFCGEDARENFTVSDGKNFLTIPDIRQMGFGVRKFGFNSEKTRIFRP